MISWLVVDDLGADRKLARTLLAGLGMQVEEAGSVEEALRLVDRGCRPDGVVTDLLLPGAGGYALVRELRLRPATSMVPIVVWSGRFVPEELEQVTAPWGVAAALSKPAEPEAFVSAITAALAGAPSRPAPVAAAVDAEMLRLLNVKLYGAYAALAEATAARRDLLGSLVRAQEQERREVAAGVHDDVVQVMVAVVLRLEAAKRQLAADPALLEMCVEVTGGVRDAIDRLRTLVFDLRPADEVLATLGGALHSLAERHAARRTLAVDVDVQESGPSADEVVVMYRIAQEALNNVVRHAGARSVRIEARPVAGGHRVVITDDGVGPGDLVAPAGHAGVAIMRERAHLAGGWLHIRPGDGRGTVVDYWVPRLEAA